MEENKENKEAVKLTIEKLEEILPHGSGIDSDWYFEEKENKIIASCSYHCMDDVGYYDGWVDFSLTIPKNNPENFKLTFHTDYNGWNRIYKYMLRDYLEDIFAFAIQEAN